MINAGTILETIGWKKKKHSGIFNFFHKNTSQKG